MNSKSSSIDIFLYYPNIIGYIRVICMILSFILSKHLWLTSIVFYLAGFVGDVVDGYVARAFNQCSTFGGILDMVTDRVSTCGLMVILSGLYKEYEIYFILLIILDISSHWFHVLSVSGHHKSAESLMHRNPILRWYYSIYPLFGYCCVGTELFYVLLFITYHYPSTILEQICFMVCLPACILKQIVNIIQLTSGADAIAQMDANAIESKSK